MYFGGVEEELRIVKVYDSTANQRCGQGDRLALFSPSTEAGYKSQSPASCLHFLFLSIKNDKLYLLKPLARFRVPVCTFLVKKQECTAQIYSTPPPLSLLIVGDE